MILFSRSVFCEGRNISECRWNLVRYLLFVAIFLVSSSLAETVPEESLTTAEFSLRYYAAPWDEKRVEIQRTSVFVDPDSVLVAGEIERKCGVSADEDGQPAAFACRRSGRIADRMRAIRVYDNPCCALRAEQEAAEKETVSFVEALRDGGGKARIFLAGSVESPQTDFVAAPLDETGVVRSPEKENRSVNFWKMGFTRLPARNAGARRSPSPSGNHFLVI